MRLLVGLLLSLFIVLPGASARAEPYLLGPGDTVHVRAVTWNEATRSYDLWDVMSGDYAVQADGRIIVPLAGPLTAEGQGVVALSEALADALRAGGSSITAPELAISIVEYRPFYVTGDVARPGAYPGRPGLTALQAVALAGGVARPDEQAVGGRDGLREASRLVRVMGETARARARMARLEAEMAGLGAIAFPADLSHPEGAAVLDQIAGGERAIFETRAAGFALQVETLNDLGALLTAEIDGLEKKLAGHAERIRLAQEELSNINQLADRGLARAPQIAAIQNRLLDLEGEETDLVNNIYRARQRLTENARDLVELRTRREADVAQDLQRVRDELERLAVDRDMLERMLVAEGVSEAANVGLRAETIYSVVRGADGRSEAVAPTDRIRPGDVLMVTTVLLPPEQATQ